MTKNKLNKKFFARRALNFLTSLFLITITSTPSLAGDLFDDVFNALSMGEYHKQYVLEKDRVNRDIAHSQRVHQENLKSIEADSARRRLALYKGQYDLAQLNLKSLNEVTTVHTQIMTSLRYVLQSRLQANGQLADANSIASELSSTYELLGSFIDVDYDKNYVEKIRARWWEAMVEIEAESKANNMNMDQFLKGEFNKLDIDSIEHLYSTCGFFSKLVASLVVKFDSDVTKYEKLYKEQDKIVTALSVH